MALHNGQSLLPRPYTSISPAPSTSSSDNNSLFSANASALGSDSTTPRLTPDHDCVVTAQSKPAGKWVQQNEVAEYQQQGIAYQLQPRETAYQPQPLRQHQRPYPDEIYAPQPAYAIPQYAPRPAYAPNYAFPARVATGMMCSRMEMGLAGGVIPPHAPGTQYMGSCSQYPYAYPQYAYPLPAPQTMNYAALSILPSAPLQSAAPLVAPVSQTLVHNGLLTEQREPGTQPFFTCSAQQQTESIVNSFPPNDAAYSYNPLASEDAHRAEEPVVQPQVPAQMQESMSPAHYAALGQQMAYPNAGCMQQLAPAGSSSVPSSSQKGKRKRRASDDDAAKPQPKKSKQKRLHPSQDPTFRRDGVDDKGCQLWKCQLPQCIHWPPLQTNSVHNHRQSNCHLQRRDNFTCQYCGQYSSRKDSLKRHLKACKRKEELEREQNAEIGFVAHDTAEPGPSSMQQHVPTLSLSTGNFSSIVASQPKAPAPRAELSSVPQEALGVPPLLVFAEEIAMPYVQVSVQAPRHEPRLVSRQASGIPTLPVFAQELSMPPRSIPQQASGAPLPPVVAADFSIDATEEDHRDLFSLPEMPTSLALSPVPAVQEGTVTADKSVDGSALGFDTTALDMSFDDWMNPAVYADSNMDFSPFLNN